MVRRSSIALVLPLTLSTILSYALESIASHSPSAASTEAQNNLICHTSNSLDCYPAIFSPTKDFQLLHDDQSIPPGLHVRMNLATGVKEARLNVPEDGERDESDIVVIENSALEDETISQAPQSKLAKALILQDLEQHYDAFNADTLLSGSRNLTANTGSIGSYTSIASEIMSTCTVPENESCLQALESMEELAHDLEWGVVLAEDRELSQFLSEFLSSKPTEADIERRSGIALLLGTALQNNEKALQILLNQSKGYCSLAAIIAEQLYFIRREHELRGLSAENYTYASRLVFLLSQLCADDRQLKAFAARGGFDALTSFYMISIHESSTGPRRKLHVRILNFVTDYALAIRNDLGEGVEELVKATV